MKTAEENYPNHEAVIDANLVITKLTELKKKLYKET